MSRFEKERGRERGSGAGRTKERELEKGKSESVRDRIKREKSFFSQYWTAVVAGILWVVYSVARCIYPTLPRYPQIALLFCTVVFSIMSCNWITGIAKAGFVLAVSVFLCNRVEDTRHVLLLMAFLVLIFASVVFYIFSYYAIQSSISKNNSSTHPYFSCDPLLIALGETHLSEKSQFLENDICELNEREMLLLQTMTHVLKSGGSGGSGSGGSGGSGSEPFTVVASSPRHDLSADDLIADNRTDMVRRNFSKAVELASSLPSSSSVEEHLEESMAVLNRSIEFPQKITKDYSQLVRTIASNVAECIYRRAY